MKCCFMIYIILINIFLLYSYINNQLGPYPDAVNLCRAIDQVLPMNKMQRLIIEKVFHSLINAPISNCDQRENQLLLYVCGKDGVGKSYVVHRDIPSYCKNSILLLLLQPVPQQITLVVALFTYALV